MLRRGATRIGLIAICLSTAYMAYTTNPAHDIPAKLQTSSLAHHPLKPHSSTEHSTSEEGASKQDGSKQGGTQQDGKNIQTRDFKPSVLTVPGADATAKVTPSDKSPFQDEKAQNPVSHQKIIETPSQTVTSGQEEKATSLPLKTVESQTVTRQEAPTATIQARQDQNHEHPEQIKLALARPDETVKTDETIHKQPESKELHSSSHIQAKTREDLKLMFDTALKPVQEITLDTEDKAALSEALKLIKKEKNTEALALITKIKTPVGQKFVRWYSYRNDPHSYSLSELKDFIQDNKDWPSQDNLRIAVESHIFRASSKHQKDYFSQTPAMTAIGMITQASHLFKEGKQKEGAELINQVWLKKESSSAEREILENYKKHLASKNIRMKVDYYLCNKQIASAQTIAKHLDEKERKIVEKRISIIQKPKKAAQIIDALSAEDKLDPGILFERIKLARSKKNYEQAWELFKKVPTDPVLLGDPDVWWPEREKLFREAFEQKKYTTAYDLVKNHSQLSVNNLNEAEFLAGWIAYRFLKKPEIGYKHFEVLVQSVDGPISKSKAYYWLGRTALDLGEKTKAQKHFEEGARFFNTFYGQLSRQSITPENSILELPALPVPSDQEIAAFQKRDVIKALMLAHHLEIDGMAGIFFSHLKEKLQSPGEVILLAELAMRLGYHQQAVRIGKSAMARGINAIDYSYPIGLLPEFKALRKLPENAFYYGITRQESEFNSNTVSHAGAKGLMQVMPITAKHVAQQHKIKYEPDRLLKDTSYNVMIATAYIADRMDEYDGSYIKAIAGFNAGPGRVREWVKTFGNPSHSDVDPIDWIEGIPFDETRGYVVKVLSNIQMYRSRLGQPQTALKLRQDLYRDRKDAENANKALLASN